MYLPAQYSGVIQQALAAAAASNAASSPATPAAAGTTTTTSSVWQGQHVNPGFVNPAYNPTQNDNGYTRFDYTQYGSGLERVKTYADAVKVWETYSKLKPGEPGYDHFVGALNKLQHNFGISDWTKATDQQLFEAFDLEFRGLQEDNTKTNFGFGDILGLAIPAIAGVATAGLAGPALGLGSVASGALGGAASSIAGGAIQGNLSPLGVLGGAALGGLSAYASPKVSSLFGSNESFVNPSALGLSAANLYNPASLGGSLGNAVTTLPGGALLNASALGGTGVLNQALGLASQPAPVTGLSGGGFTNTDALGVSGGNLLDPDTTFAGLSGSGSSAAGGGSVSLFDDFLGIIPELAGDVIGGLLTSHGNSQAYDQALSAAQDSQLIVQPTPFQGKSLFLQTSPSGTASVTDYGQNHLNQIGGINAGAYNRALNFDADSFAARLLEAANGVYGKREAQDFASLESKLFNQQGASTGTARQIADFQSDIEDRRYLRALDAEIQADAMRRGLLGDYAGTFSMIGDFNDRYLEQQQQALQGAQLLAPYGINNPAVANAGQLRAISTQDFFDALGGTAGGYVDAGLSALFSSLGIT